VLSVVDVEADCPPNHRYMNHYQPRRSRPSDRRNNPRVVMTEDSCRRTLTTKLVSCCKCPRPRRCRRRIGGAVVEHQLRCMTGADAAEAGASRAAAVLAGLTDS